MGISLGLVGLGAFGSVFARLFKSHPLVDRVGLCDREPERVARFAEDASFGDKFTPSDAYESFDFVFSEGEYFHDIEHGLREVSRRRLSSKSGQEWVERSKKYAERGIRGGSMHYPTHSISGPMSVMKAHAKKVCAWGWQPQDDEGTSENTFSNETALFQMSNGSTMRICEYRRIGQPCREMFNILGTKGCFYGAEGNWGENKWFGIREKTVLSVEDMRKPLPDEVLEAFQMSDTTSNIYGGHGGSHPYLAHEFVDAVAHKHQPAINAWEAVRYMAAGVMAHKSALKDGETLEVPDWGDAPE